MLHVIKASRKFHRSMSRWALSLWVLGNLFPAPVRAYDLGLSTRFSDVILENLQIGETYNISVMKSLPLTIINTSTIETEVQIEVDAPKPEELKEGYEAIPDPTWVKVFPNRFRVVPAGRNLSDIIMTIPNDPKLIGRHFQVMFWAHTLETGFLGVGVRVRVRFSIGARSPESVKAEMKKKKMLDLNFRLDPVAVTVNDVQMGKTIDLKKDANVSVKLVNTGSTELKLEVVSAKFLPPQTPPQGYEAIPDLSWLEVTNPAIMSEPDSIVPLKLKLKVPDKPEYRGKKYAALIIVNLVGEEIPLNVSSQVLFSTPQ